VARAAGANGTANSVKAKRAQKATPAEEDLAATRAKAKKPARDKSESKTSSARAKKTGFA